MSTRVKERYGPYFELLSMPEQRVVEKYVEAMSQIYPELAETATAGPGHEGDVYLYVHVPADEDKDIEIHEAMAKIGLEILLGTGVSVLLMPARGW